MKTEKVLIEVDVPEGAKIEYVYYSRGAFRSSSTAFRILDQAAPLAVEPVRWLMSYRGVSALDICHLPDVVHSEKRAIEVVNQVKRAGHDAWYEPLYSQPQPAVAVPLAVSDEQIQAVWNEACKDTPSNPGWNRHIRFARLLLATSPEAKKR